MKVELVAGAFIAGTLAQNPTAVYDTFYPPSLDSTKWITDDSIGTYHGSIYHAKTFNSTTDTTYGTYNYCFMPHPRAQEYKTPEPVANGSVKAELVYLQYIQRHHRRTAYNILPGGEVLYSPSTSFSDLETDLEGWRRYVVLTSLRTKPIIAITSIPTFTQDREPTSVHRLPSESMAHRTRIPITH